jgi:hypothetical protein
MEDTYMERRVVRVMTLIVGYFTQPRNNNRNKSNGTSQQVKNDINMNKMIRYVP